jgi:cobalt-zinc-cadmium efflux system protein
MSERKHAASHHHHSHLTPPAPTGSPRRVAIALALIVAFMVVEVTAGILAHSLALVSDAGHMLTDAAALAVSLIALRMAARPAQGSLTYGLRRVETLAAQLNGATLLVVAVLILYEAIRRLISPPDVSAWPMVVVGVAGIAVNGAATSSLAGAGRENLNVESSFQHVLMDLFAFVGTVAAGVVILLTGFERADPLISIAIAAIMLVSAVRLLAAAGRVILEAAPAGLDPPEIGRALAAMPDVVEVHDLHVWQVGSGFPALSAHVLVKQHVDCHAVRRALEQLLRERYGLAHSTLQVDHAGGDELIELRPPRSA